MDLTAGQRADTKLYHTSIHLCQYSCQSFGGTGVNPRKENIIEMFTALSTCNTSKFSIYVVISHPKLATQTIDMIQTNPFNEIDAPSAIRRLLFVDSIDAIEHHLCFTTTRNHISSMCHQSRCLFYVYVTPTRVHSTHSKLS